MRLKPRAWFLVSLLLFAVAICVWQYANQYGAQPRQGGNPPAPVKAAAAQNKPKHPPVIKTAATVAKRKSYRITNTTQKFAQLLHNSHALILRNALIDTEVPVALKIPDYLRAKGAPGSYLVQADRPLDSGFYAELSKAGASYISYVPNNAALVEATPMQATNLAANADVVVVLPYEPYYKLDSTLLPSAVEQQPQTNELSVTTFPGQRDAAVAALTQLGAKFIGEDRSPFGPTLIVSVPPQSLVAVAQMPLAQEIEVYTPRRKLNDLTRVLMGDATNTLNTPNYLNLTGAHVTVNLNDSGVDATHPDFSPTGRLIGDNPGSLTDTDGHGTHVAGIIAGNGSKSSTVTSNVPGSIIPGANFRGKATNATLYVQALDLNYGPFISDAFLQENASTNLGPTNLISNNSWGYGSTVYDSHAASFDAATRDAQPNVDGEQPLLFVFAAGNNGGDLTDNGINGEAGSITSPGTAKNVITVGASDSPRYITNSVYTTASNDTSELFYGETSSTNLVAGFSSCGNVDAGVEGLYGRFKPDVVAPGVFTVSCRAADYVDPTNEVIVTDYSYLGQLVGPAQTNTYFLPLPYDTSGVYILISSNAVSPIPFPTNMLILGDPFEDPPTDVVSTNNYYNLTNFNPGDIWFIGIASPTNEPDPVNYDLNIFVYETNSDGDYFQVLSNLNSVLKPWYRYETGTSMSAGAVSGTLALMQEFLQSRMGITNPSPALLKAMLINGSRSLGNQYDFNVNTQGANEQGWGMPNLPSSIPASLTNANHSMVLHDQSPNNALGTGQYQTYTVTCSDTNAAAVYPLRISLVWTDPPGNPAAGVALVNNLELTVADATGTNIFIGNNFRSGDIFTEVSSATNLPAGESDNDVQNVYVNNGTPAFTAAGDTINNVQNVYINPAVAPIQFPLTVTISGTRINVNAVTTQTNNILQDYALVISSDDPALTGPLVVTPGQMASNNAPLITVASNGVPYLHQRVGANEPNLYNFTLGDTNGSLAQWHFFVFSNNILTISNATNVAFATFLPPNLSIPRASGSADIDLYVYAPAVPLDDFATFITTPGNFDIFANLAVKSLGPTGTESVIFTNSTVPVYYIGVKSEDQQASDFGFYGIAQSNSFSTTSSDGNTINATATSLPVLIPNGLSPTPALVFAFMVNVNPLETMIRRVTVTLGIQHQDPTDLYGTLQHNEITATLNHNTSTLPNSGFTNTYDDLQEDPNSGDVTSDGPGKLTQFVGQQASGLWLLTEYDNYSDPITGYVTTFNVSVDLQQPPTGFFVTIPGDSWFDDYVDVPNDATNMIIYTLYESEGTNAAGLGPIGIFLTNEIGVIQFNDYGSNDIVPPGGSLSLSTNDPVPGWPGAPPLAGGYWYYGIYNSNTAPVTLYVVIQFQESLTPNLVQTYTNTGPPIPLTTDAHTQSQICVGNGQQLVDLQVGLLLQDTNLDDLVIHLTSPEGTSVLLMEDRGGTNASGLGMELVVTNVSGATTNLSTNYSTNLVYTVFTENTNLAPTPIKFAPPPYSTNAIIPPAVLWSNSFETVTNGVYTNGAILEGWLVTSNIITTITNGGPVLMTNDEVGIVTDPNGELIGSNSLGSNYLALTSGHIIQTFGVASNFFNINGISNNFLVTNGEPYELVFYAKPMGIVDWWPGNDNPDDIIGTNNGIVSSISATNYVTNGANITTNITVTPFVTYDTGEVGRAFDFNATNSTVSFGTNTGNFGTNDFSIDFWVKTAFSNGVVPLLQKGSYCTNDIDYLGVLLTNGSVCYVQSLNSDVSSFSLISPTNIADGLLFHHVAVARQGLVISIYIDGLLSTNETDSEVSTITNTNFFVAGGLNCTDGPFIGDLDEIDLFNRALSPAEVYAIYNAGSLGKFNTNSLLPNFQLTIDGLSTNTVLFTNASGGWQLFTNTFYATNNQITVEFSGNPMGVLFDDIQLVQLAATNYNNYYQPEEPLTPFIGENPLGCWTLDVWDTRTDSPLPVNGTLLGWTLQLTTSSTNATLYVLQNGVPFTLTNAATNGISYFAVDVPYYVTYATNLLTAVSGGPFTLYFDQNALPTGGLPGDVTLQTSVPIGTTSTNILATLGAPPPLLPGRRYFLGVLNGATVPPGNFTIEVDFNGLTNKIIPLTNDMPYTNIVGTNTIGTNGPEYYSFTVPTNAVLVTFQILNATNGEVDLYARQGLPVPGPSFFDYESCNAGTNDQFIAVTTNSVPVPLQTPSTNLLQPNTPTTWYLAAYNFADVSNISYTIVATVVTNGGMTIIPLTNGIPYTNTASPGYPSNLVYSFTITNDPTAVQFTVTNLTNMGNVELLASLDGFPTPEVFYDGSFNPGTNAQIMQIYINPALTNLNGVWYLSVPNTSNTNVTYAIMATTNLPVTTNPPPIVPLTWAGRIPGPVNDGRWDILGTSNWLGTVSNVYYPFQNGSAVTFDDTAQGTTTVVLTTTLSPSSITNNNNNLTYTFKGGGSITGASLTKNGSGILIIDNSTLNNFSSVTLTSGTLQIGDNDANGSLATSGGLLGPGTFNTENGNLAFDRSDNILISNVISGSGSLSQTGTGTLTLSATNTYGGITYITDGTLVVDNTNALGNATGGAVYISDGGTLDLGGLAAPNGPADPLFDGKDFVIAGDGVGSNGAIVNNGIYQQLGGLEYLDVTNDATIGGTARWDVRGTQFGGATNEIEIENCTLTKTGSNQINLASTYLTAGFNGISFIIINQGIVSFEGTPDFDLLSTISIIVNSNGLVGQILNTTNSFTCPIVLNGGGVTNMSGGGITYLDADILLTNNSSLGNGGGIELFNGIISGTFGFTNLGPGSNLLSATNTYTGSTIVAQGTLALTNYGSITNSTNITVNSGATLDATQRADQTLTLVSNQTLFDSGTVLGSNVVAGPGSIAFVATNGIVISNLAATNATVFVNGTVSNTVTANSNSIVYGSGLMTGNLLVDAISTVSPGAAPGTIGTLTVGGTALLRGTTYIKLDKAMAPGQSNDVLVASNLVCGGTLLVTNLDATNSFVAGDSFKIFNASNSVGTFSMVILPPLPDRLAWANNFATNGGTLTVVANSQPSIQGVINITASGSNLILSGTNGVPGGEYVVLTSTNLLDPLTNWLAILTNYFNDSGSFTNAMTNVMTNEQQFYILETP